MQLFVYYTLLAVFGSKATIQADISGRSDKMTVTCT